MMKALEIPILATLLVLLPQPAVTSENSSGMAGIETVCVDDEATAYGTFQSHNQKVLQNGAGIFMAHIRSRNEPYTAQCWRLLRSQDGGETFSIVHEATDATNPAVIETDRDDNLYLIRPDWADGNAYFYRFLKEKDFKDPVVTKIPGGAAGKFCAEIDLARDQIYYFAINNMFCTIGLDGEINSSIQLTQNGENALIQYPHLHLAPSGVLYAAWTTQKHGVYLYWDIHSIKSEDGGKSWKTLSGKDLQLPIVADDGGPADQITQDDEFEVHTWLANFLYKDNKLHFFYEAQFSPSTMNYVRYDLGEGRQDLRLSNGFHGETIQPLNLDGFFATKSSTPGSPLYCISRAGTRLVCIVSEDNGETWHDYAVSQPFRNPYSIGGCREITEDGNILGSFTDQSTDEAHPSKVYFFKIKTNLTD